MLEDDLPRTQPGVAGNFLAPKGAQGMLMSVCVRDKLNRALNLHFQAQIFKCNQRAVRGHS